MDPKLLGSKAITAYRTAAIHLLNSLIAIILLNIALAFAFSVKDRRTPSPPPGPVPYYPKEHFAQVYPHMKEDQWMALLRETWDKPFAFESFTHFRETPATGTYVNIGEHGFRMNARRPPWPPEPDAFNVFFFGGSTTFGYGVSDEETIPSALEEFLTRQGCVNMVRVYNFGRGYYYSSQEQVLFLRLLAGGFVPRLAIFLDGINESRGGVDDPHWSDEFRRYLLDRDAASTGFAIELRPEIPILRFARSLRSRLDGILGRQSAPASDVGMLPEGDAQKLAALDVQRYLRNRGLTETLAAQVGVETLFVWQPSPAYGYNLAYHLFQPEKQLVDIGRQIYSQFSEHRTRLTGPERERVLWLGDLQSDRREPLYVDAFHYTAAFSQEIAEQIGQALAARHLVCRAV